MLKVGTKTHIQRIFEHAKHAWCERSMCLKVKSQRRRGVKSLVELQKMSI